MKKCHVHAEIHYQKKIKQILITMTKDTYSVETREDLRGGDDYSENHENFETPEEVQKYINGLHSDERVFSVNFYRAGTDGNPKDVTNKFKRK